jgi:hypothetical protein
MENLENNEENLLIDLEILESYIKLILTADPDAPDLLAHLLVKLKKAIEIELQPQNQISDTLNVAIELTYLHTKAHTAALKLYTLYQRGELMIQDYPLELINAAIERSRPGDEFNCEADKKANGETDSEE